MTTPQSTYASFRPSTDAALQVHATRAEALKAALGLAHDLIQHTDRYLTAGDVVAYARKFAEFLTPTSDANSESPLQEGS